MGRLKPVRMSLEWMGLADLQVSCSTSGTSINVSFSPIAGSDWYAVFLYDPTFGNTTSYPSLQGGKMVDAISYSPNKDFSITVQPYFAASQQWGAYQNYPSSGLMKCPAAPTSCNISGNTYQNGALNPSNPCQSCQPSQNLSVWTNVTDGTVCPLGQCSNGTCQSTCPSPCTASGNGGCTFYFQSNYNCPGGSWNIGEQAFDCQSACPYTVTNNCPAACTSSGGLCTYYSQSQYPCPGGTWNIGEQAYECQSACPYTVTNNCPAACTSSGGLCTYRFQSTYACPGGTWNIGEQAFDCQSACPYTVTNNCPSPCTDAGNGCTYKFQSAYNCPGGTWNIGEQAYDCQSACPYIVSNT